MNAPCPAWSLPLARLRSLAPSTLPDLAVFCSAPLPAVAGGAALFPATGRAGVL